VMCQDEVKTIHLSLIMHLEVSNEANLWLRGDSTYWALSNFAMAVILFVKLPVHKMLIFCHNQNWVGVSFLWNTEWDVEVLWVWHSLLNDWENVTVHWIIIYGWHEGKPPDRDITSLVHEEVVMLATWTVGDGSRDSWALAKVNWDSLLTVFVVSVTQTLKDKLQCQTLD
jgi:hypothetical protein